MNSGNMPAWDHGMRGVSLSAYIITPVSVAAIWSHGYFTGNKELLRNGYKSAVAIGTALVLATGLKYAVNRTRPYTYYPDDITRRSFDNGPYSFPSGHTTMAFATATSLSLSYKKWYVTATSFVYAGLVGYSRMRLGVHYSR